MYRADPDRYSRMPYRRVGTSGLKLPAISLGMWQNFGSDAPYARSKEILEYAFDCGITHFDLANNYGSEHGSAELTLGKVMRDSLHAYRDELIISTKAGYYMWEGPYGEYGSKKYLTASLDQSLKRMGLGYVDIFYSHRFDPDTDLEETVSALDLFVRQGKALYIGISNYSAEETRRAAKLFSELRTPFIIHQPVYNMLNRWVESELLDDLSRMGKGAIAFSPLAGGMLTGRYAEGIPAGSRAAANADMRARLSDGRTAQQISALTSLAKARGQTLPQLAVAWLLRRPELSSVLVGVSKKEQLSENLKALDNITFTDAELAEIDRILK